jgi:hypothetical protein
MIDEVLAPSPSTATDTNVAPEPSRGSRYTIEVTLPAYLHEEVMQVAHSEDCDLSDIVQNALDEYLSDHWVRI